MFLTITTTGTPESPATDLGFLLHKHPDKAQRFSTSHGTAHVFYPEASVERCTAALLLEVDPVALVRRGQGKGRGGAPDAALAQYVNDRPYAASSLMSVALAGVFKSALRGVCAAQPERAAAPLPLRVEVPALPARGGAELVHKLFGPLGWSSVSAEPIVLDERFPEWGDSRYVRLVLEGELRLADALRQLYVLLPVLDDAKHYWVAPDEVDKLLRAGDGWLADHPEQKLITSRYLSRRWGLARQAMERLELVRLAEVDGLEVEQIDNAVDESTDTAEQPVPLAAQRRTAILATLEAAGASRVLDLGCGQGQLVQELLKNARFTEVVGVDVSMRALTVAARRLRTDRMTERQTERLTLMQGSLAYTDTAAFTEAYRRYCWTTDGLDGVRLAPFQILAVQGRSLAAVPHDEQLAWLDRLVEHDPTGLLRATARLVVDTGDEASVRAGVDWWLELTGAGGEGMVVKPLQALARDGKGRLVQPGVKVRGREYLRIIYGPEYTRPDNLERLRQRFLGHKRSLALREYALGLEALARLADGEPLWRVHEAVFAVLALESEPVDPRL
ncbi:3' terminal RNA ribose 2'-O-methyltransferase Hen1 [Streptomyces xanthochromogenes]|uniref:3' terminal RNA ribose 2'-O-methyltransferase Hen1 n=1 Tax=Streptomyces xanthochromogenes TaxID=67384 RepID=UPI00342B7BBD